MAIQSMPQPHRDFPLEPSDHGHIPPRPPVSPEAHVAVLDDDAALRKLVGEYLERQGMRVSLVATGTELRALLGRENVDALVLDLMMPGEDGLAVLRELRTRANPPLVVMLSAMAADTDRIIGLELGADDYLAKPVNPRELVARLRAVLRRKSDQVLEPLSAAPCDEHVLRFSGWEIDPLRYSCRTPSGEELELTSGEFRLLHALASRAARIIPRDQLIAAVHGGDTDMFDRAIDVAVSRLRAKLREHGGQHLIRTVRGEGYLFAGRS